MHKWIVSAGLVIFVSLIVALPSMAFAVPADELIFIVHKANPLETIELKDLSDYFFKVKREWPDGTLVRFIDRKTSNERKIFLGKIIKKTEEEVGRFWIGQKLFTGDSAPVQSGSDLMSIQFVETFPGAIGYLSSTTVVTSKGVKIIKLKQ